MTPPNFKAYEHIYRYHKRSRIHRWLIAFAALLALVLFLPWTQNIRTTGTVTTLGQEQRPQQINTIIGGRIEKWYVREGDYVRKGDTLVQLSEIKEEYLDPQLLGRTQEQLTAKQLTVDYYQQKVAATESQIVALNRGLAARISQLQGKLQQLRVKLQSDSVEMMAAANDWRIAQVQYGRQKVLHDSGLVSLTQLEGRSQAVQNAVAKKISAENKYVTTRQELAIVQLELAAAEQENREKIAKAEGDRLQSLSQIAGSSGEIAKLQNQYASYAIRNGLYYITAPQDGQVVKARAAGIGEVFKEGELLVHIVPQRVDYAVELHVRPVDLPLIAPGQAVRLLFDGFPALVFSGWPEASYGTFSGIVTAVESVPGSSGKFRVLVKEDKDFKPWPQELKIGTGANAIALLKNVPVWYELWRNINSFPPDFYQPTYSTTEKKP
ncbi:MAG TPA: HlyD family efflux transporter periplasmic adaptor subunit [Chitinophagaceae bacterium]